MAALAFGRWPDTVLVWLVAGVGAWPIAKLIAAEARRVGPKVQTNVECADF